MRMKYTSRCTPAKGKGWRSDFVNREGFRMAETSRFVGSGYLENHGIIKYDEKNMIENKKTDNLHTSKKCHPSSKD